MRDFQLSLSGLSLSFWFFSSGIGNEQKARIMIKVSMAAQRC